MKKVFDAEYKDSLRVASPKITYHTSLDSSWCLFAPELVSYLIAYATGWFAMVEKLDGGGSYREWDTARAYWLGRGSLVHICEAHVSQAPLRHKKPVSIPKMILTIPTLPAHLTGSAGCLLEGRAAGQDRWGAGPPDLCHLERSRACLPKGLVKLL